MEKGKGYCMKVNCDIVRDILPLYVEGMTSEASSKLVEGHLTQCEECTEYLKELGGELSAETAGTFAVSSGVMGKFKQRYFDVMLFVVMVIITILASVSLIISSGYLSKIYTGNPLDTNFKIDFHYSYEVDNVSIQTSQLDYLKVSLEKEYNLEFKEEFLKKKSVLLTLTNMDMDVDVVEVDGMNYYFVYLYELSGKNGSITGSNYLGDVEDVGAVFLKDSSGENYLIYGEGNANVIHNEPAKDVIHIGNIITGISIFISIVLMFILYRKAFRSLSINGNGIEILSGIISLFLIWTVIGGFNTHSSIDAVLDIWVHWVVFKLIVTVVFFAGALLTICKSSDVKNRFDIAIFILAGMICFQRISIPLVDVSLTVASYTGLTLVVVLTVAVLSCKVIFTDGSYVVPSKGKAVVDGCSVLLAAVVIFAVMLSIKNAVAAVAVETLLFIGCIVVAYGVYKFLVCKNGLFVTVIINGIGLVLTGRLYERAGGVLDIFDPAIYFVSAPSVVCAVAGIIFFNKIVSKYNKEKNI